MKIRRPVVANRFLWLSVILFLVSLALPGIYFVGPLYFAEQCRDVRMDPLPECKIQSAPGYSIFFLGWLDNPPAPAWFANLLLPVLWWDMKRTKLRGVLGWILSIGGSVLALSALSVTSVPSGGLGRNDVQSFGLGFYLWAASFLVCIVGYAVTRIRREAS